MSARVRYDQVRAVDLLVADHLPTCECGDLCPPTASICDCGKRLVPYSTAVGGSTLDVEGAADGTEVTLPMTPKCSCGERGLCTVCVLAEYDSGQGV